MAEESDLWNKQNIGSISVPVRVSPNSSRTQINGFAPEADDSKALKVSLTAVPEAGKANTQLLKLLAKEWRFPRRDLSIIRGTSDRRKTIAIEGEPTKVRRLLTDWMERHHG